MLKAVATGSVPKQPKSPERSTRCRAAGFLARHLATVQAAVDRKATPSETTATNSMA
jgi:hypothetical protein